MTTNTGDRHAQLWQRIVAAWAATGLPLASLTRADLVALDEFHAGGREATRALARLAGLKSGMAVLDVGSGLGGPARTLATEVRCRVTGVEQEASYLVAARCLTRQLNLGGRVAFVQGAAPLLPFGRGSFDVVWLQHLLPAVRAKSRLFAQLRQILIPGGRLLLHEPLTGPTGAAHFPLPWAERAEMSYLVSARLLRAQLEEAGFRMVAWQTVTAETVAWFRKQREADPVGSLSLSLILGESAGQRVRNLVSNLREGRVRVIRAVFERPL